MVPTAVVHAVSLGKCPVCQEERTRLDLVEPQFSGTGLRIVAVTVVVCGCNANAKEPPCSPVFGSG